MIATTERKRGKHQCPHVGSRNFISDLGSKFQKEQTGKTTHREEHLNKQFVQKTNQSVQPIIQEIPNKDMTRFDVSI